MRGFNVIKQHDIMMTQSLSQIITSVSPLTLRQKGA